MTEPPSGLVTVYMTNGSGGFLAKFQVMPPLKIQSLGTSIRKASRPSPCWSMTIWLRKTSGWLCVGPPRGAPDWGAGCGFVGGAVCGNAGVELKIAVTQKIRIAETRFIRPLLIGHHYK